MRTQDGGGSLRLSSSAGRKGDWEVPFRLLSTATHLRYRERSCQLEVLWGESETAFVVCDEGGGFDWQPFLEIDEQRLLAPNGRGIAMARMLSFIRVDYLGRGNRVRAVAKRSGS